MNILANGWEYAEIGNLCLLINGKAFKPSDWTNEGLKIVRIQNLNNHKAKYNHFSGEIESKFIINNGELLFAWSGTPGTSFGAHIWNGNTAVLNQHIFRVIFNETLLNKTFFRIAINYKLQELISKAHGGVGLRHVTKGKFEKTKISLPPLNEQKRIVTKIEALQTRSTAVKEELKAIKPLLNQFRQSVLASAFRGDLTKDWREQNRDIPWEYTTLESVIKDRPRNGYSPKAVDYPTQVKSFSLSATTSGIFKPEYFKYIDQFLDLYSYLWLKPGDVLIQRSNTLEYVGTSAIYTGQFGDFIYPDTVMKIQVDEDKTTNKFIHYSLSNKKTRQYFKDNATGTAGNMPKINQKTVMNTPVSLPTIEEQKEIVRRIESLFKLADSIEQQYQQAEIDLETLNQSILAKAFRGELVPQDPNDEPASVLLERIKEERDRAKATAKKSKAKKKSSKKKDKQLGIPGM